MKLDTTLVRETPEGIELELRVAGLAPRCLAWVIDFVIRAALCLVLLFFFVWLGDFGEGLWLIAIFAIEFFYPMLFERYMEGATPGKSMLKLRVVQDDGTPLNWHAVMTRNILRIVDFFPLFYATGAITVMTNRHFKRLGDLAAGTVVVYKERYLSGLQVPQNKAAPLPSALHAEEQLTLINFARALPRLSSARAEELAGLLRFPTQQQPASSQELLAYANWILGQRDT